MHRYIIILILSTIFNLAGVAHSQNNFWQRTNSPAEAFSALAVSGKDTIFAGSSLLFTNNNIALRSLDGGQTWTPMMAGLLNNGLNNLLVDESDIVWAGTVGQNVWRSENNGDTWQATGLNDEDGLVLSLASSGNGTICAGLSGSFPGIVYCYSQNNPRWQFEDSGFSPNANGHNVVSLAIDPGNNVYAGVVHDVNSMMYDGIYRLNANGDTWEPIFPSTFAVALLAHPNGDIFASVSGDVFRSTDSGATWQPFNTGLDGGVGCFAVNSVGDIFAGRANGVYRVKNGETTWMKLNEGLTDSTIYALAFNNQDVLFAATDSGIFKRSTVTAINNTPGIIPGDFVLQQNYPNPFNPETTIAFELGKATSIELVIFDTNGRRITTLVRGKQPPGVHTAVWDGTDHANRLVASGIYVYTLSAGGRYVNSKKLLFLK